MNVDTFVTKTNIYTTETFKEILGQYGLRFDCKYSLKDDQNRDVDINSKIWEGRTYRFDACGGMATYYFKAIN